jgi:hypothetical protein
VRHQAAVVVDLAERLLESHSGVAGVARAAVEGLVAELRRAAPPPLAAAS